MSTILRGMTWRHPRGHGSVVAASTRYLELGHGVGASWDQRSLQAFADEPLAGLADRYDLLVIDHPHIPLAAEQGILLPLQGRGRDVELDHLARHSVGASHRSYRSGGDQLALAVDAATQVAAYRPDLLPEPPRTWPEVLRLARAGRVLWPAGPIDAYSSLLTVAVNLGGAPFATAGVFLDHDVLGEALGRLRQLRATMPPQVLAMNPVDVAEAMTTTSQWSYCPLLYGYTNYARCGFRPHRLRYRDMPDAAAGGSLLGGAGIAVSASTHHPGAAVDLAFWLASAPVQRGPWFDGGGQPAHADAWDDETLDERTWAFFSGTRATIESAWVRPRWSGYLTFQDTISPLVTAHLAGDLSEAELVAAADAAAEEGAAGADQ